MTGPEWSADAPGDSALIVSNCASLLAALRADAAERSVPTPEMVKDWHRRAYEGCSVPMPSYVGHFRGDPAHSKLVGYEVGVGPVRADGLPEGVGVWSAEVAGQVDAFFSSLEQALGELDARYLSGTRLTTAADLREVVALAAVVHGEWIRIHPFVNGNGRIARVWTAFVAFRYGLPAFVQLKPRPAGSLYARAAQKSMGRPPDFMGDHEETTAIFAHWLRLHLEA